MPLPKTFTTAAGGDIGHKGQRARGELDGIEALPEMVTDTGAPLLVNVAVLSGTVLQPERRAPRTSAVVDDSAARRTLRTREAMEPHLRAAVPGKGRRTSPKRMHKTPIRIRLRVP
jgi:hypothetical protein